MALRPVDLSLPLTLADAVAIANRQALPFLGPDGRARVARSRAVVDAFLREHDVPRYGINTGFGALAEVVIPIEQVEALQVNLLRSHAVGVGAPLPPETVRACVLLRAAVLAKGHSGVRPLLVDALCALLEKDVLPVLPCQGSVGASGDLAPLAHLALVLIGEGEAMYQGERLSGGEALRRAGLTPLTLGGKEGLSLINGTQVMTAIGLLAWSRAQNLLATADVVGAMTVEAQLGSVRAFDPRIVAVRPYPGAIETAHNLRALCADSPLIASHAGPDCHKVQDPYSLRCMPQVHGAVREAITFLRRTLEIEVNAVTDNPLIFPDDDGDDMASTVILSGGNFHGQPVSHACDTARSALTSLASMAERRIEQLVNPALSSGLPAFLAQSSGLNSGFMIAQVTAAALVSECKGLSMPASVDSIPSSANREDHVSMGPIAARRLTDVVEAAERVCAIELLCAGQGLDLRAPLGPGTGTRAAWLRLRQDVAPLGNDRVLYPDLEAATHLVRSGAIRLAAETALGHALHYPTEPRMTWWPLPAPLVLASTSKYRQAQLQRLGVVFTAFAPPYDEAPVAGLDARQLIAHHAVQKAKAVRAAHPDPTVWILAADQGVVVDGDVLLGKPHTAENAVAQLLCLSGKTHELRTQVVLDVPGQQFAETSIARLRVRSLTRAEAEAYVARDQPLDCAGSYKIECAGPWLFDAIDTDDPTAIEGLPLISVARLLRQAQ